MNFLNFLADEVVEGAEGTTQITFEQVWTNFKNWCITDGIRFLIALVVLFILFLITNGVAKGIRAAMRKRGRDEIVCNFVYTFVRRAVKILLLIVFLSYVGIEMSGISTIIASLGVGIGLALQGALANFAGWLILIVSRPFKLGDYVECQGVSGTVEEMNLVYTHLKTVDNKVIMIPNGNLANGNIINYSRKDIRRVDLDFSISYESDPMVAIETIMGVIRKDARILSNPEPFVKVTKYLDSQVIVTARVWVLNGEYWDVNWDLTEKVLPALKENGISIPYPQIDVHVKEK